MPDELDDRPRPSSPPSLIAWISLCLLCATWGPALAPTCRAIWGYLGLFGLVAAVGLGTLEQSRQVIQQRRERKEMQLRAEQDLAKFVRHIVTEPDQSATPTSPPATLPTSYPRGSAC